MLVISPLLTTHLLQPLLQHGDHRLDPHILPCILPQTVLTVHLHEDWRLAPLTGLLAAGPRPALYPEGGGRVHTEQRGQDQCWGAAHAEARCGLGLEGGMGMIIGGGPGSRSTWSHRSPGTIT